MGDGKFNLLSGIGTGVAVAIILKLVDLVTFSWFSVDMFKLLLLLIVGIYAGQRAVNTMLSVMLRRSG